MTLEQVLKQSKGVREGYPDIFSDDLGLDIVIPEIGLHAVRSWKNKRRATLCVQTFKGMYYGRIDVQGVYMGSDTEPGNIKMFFIGDIPLADVTYPIKLTRPITKEEIQEDPDKWKGYKEGDMTNRFNSMEELLSLAKEVFRLRFVGDWEFYAESPYTKYKL